MGVVELAVVTLTLVLTTAGMQIAAEFLFEEHALRELDGIGERVEA
jgi:hypothetical protein